MPAPEMREALVLHTLAYRDTSLIATLLVRDAGVCRALARGARKKRASLLQPSARLAITWFGRSELKTLGRMELLQSPPALSGERWYLLLYINELLSRLAGHVTEDVDIFDDCLAVLQLLETDAEAEPWLRRFEFLLLQRLGYAIDFTSAAEGAAKIDPEVQYVFQPDRGFSPVREGSSRQLHFRGAELLAIAEDDFSNRETARAAKNISRAAFLPLLGEKPLMSRALFRKTP